MSAERPRRGGSEEEAPKPKEEESELDKKLAQYGQIGLPIATVGVAVLAGSLQGPAAAVLVLTGGVLVGVIALFWGSVRTLVGETPLSGADAYALGAPRAEEEQKRAVLRALKDLEFEHGVGKISDEDYRELVAKYREEAKRLLRSIDAEAEPRRAQIEAMVNRRLRREGMITDREAEAREAEAREVEAPRAPVENPFTKFATPEAVVKGKKKSKGKAQPAASEKEAADETRVCAECATVNDADAVFCKKCGARQGKPVVSDDAPPVEAEAPVTTAKGEAS